MRKQSVYDEKIIFPKMLFSNGTPNSACRTESAFCWFYALNLLPVLLCSGTYSGFDIFIPKTEKNVLLGTKIALSLICR